MLTVAPAGARLPQRRALAANGTVLLDLWVGFADNRNPTPRGRRRNALAQRQRRGIGIHKCTSANGLNHLLGACNYLSSSSLTSVLHLGVNQLANSETSPPTTHR
jgi:hypothetical protein